VQQAGTDHHPRQGHAVPDQSIAHALQQIAFVRAAQALLDQASR